MLKTCSKCGIEKEATEFHRSSRTRDGRQSRCITCANAYSREWRQANPEYEREYYSANRDRKRDYYAANREHRTEYNREYHAANRDRLREYIRKWRQENPDAVRAHANNRRARLINAEGEITADIIQDLFNRFPVCSCGQPTEHLDHIQPLSRGGSNLPDNLIPLCSACNLQKSAKTAEEYLLTLEDTLGAARYLLHTTAGGHSFNQEPIQITPGHQILWTVAYPNPL